jgi:exopolysaccharide production protein ExoQ
MNAAVETLERSSTITRPGVLLPAVVGFYFAFRIFIVPLTALAVQDPQTGVVLNLGINFLLLGLVAFHSCGPAPRTLGSIARLPCAGWALLFLGFSGCSLAWTAAVSLPAAVAFWCAMAADLAMIMLLLRTGPIDEMVSGVMKGYVYGACCVALVAWCLPTQSDLRFGVEGLLGTNQIGYPCAFAVFLAQYLMLREGDRRRWKVYAVFLAITVLRSLSKTTIAALVAGEAVVLLRDRTISRKTKITVMAGTAVVIAAFSGLLVTYFDLYTGEGVNQAETLTGRLGIWAYFLDMALEQPWIGHGFHSVWKVIPPFGSDQFEARHAHNELLQQFYAYGVVGIGMMAGLYGSFFRMARKLAPSPVRTLLLALLVFVLVRGLADTEVFDLSLPLWAVVMFSAAATQLEERESVCAG